MNLIDESTPVKKQCHGVPDVGGIARRLLERMTLAQKIGQLNQISVSDPELTEMIDKEMVGSVILAGDAYAGSNKQPSARAELINGLQRRALKQGVPLLFARDCVHGHRTVFPIPLGQAASFSEDIVQRCARAVAVEASSDGVNWTFAPMIDISRDARWGRVAESYGEDPLLTSTLAAASVRGFQTDDLSAPDAIAACAKHFVGYGAAMGGRDYDTCEISSYSLNNIYLPPFRAAVEAGVATVMSGFHEVNGVPIAADEALVRRLLKESWGFNGVVVSDWESIGQLIHHGVARDDAHAAELALRAGNDVDMIDRAYLKHLERLALQDASIAAAIDDAALRVLRLKARLGLFENPFVDEALATRVQLSATHRALAREAARQSCVLLKNDNDVLPLKPDTRCMVTGPLAEDVAALWGTWALDGRVEDSKSIRQVFEERLGERCAFYRHFDEALWRSRWSDLSVLVLGESAWRSGEDASVTHLELPPGQLEIVRALKSRGQRVVAVVLAGRALALRELCDIADAVLLVFHPGSEAAPAIVDVLQGVSEPLGRLPVTLPRTTGQVPIYHARPRTGRPLDPTSPRQRYIDDLDVPLRPFGFGLGYGLVEIVDGSTSASLQADGVDLSVTLRNPGERPVIRLVQAYFSPPPSPRTRPARLLCAWQWVRIDPNQSSVIHLQIPGDRLTYQCVDGASHLVAGDHRFWIGFDADTRVHTNLKIDWTNRTDS